MPRTKKSPLKAPLTEPEFLPVRRVVRLLGISRSSVYELCRLGKLGHRRAGPEGRRIQITEQDVRDYLKTVPVVMPAA